ncbi:MAG: hypothetical protein HFE04_01585 [Bacilli bacterium]|nr:hypothetical protein [Bacilli bacterium]
MEILIITIIFSGILSLLYILIKIKLNNKIYKTLKEKIEEYKQNKKVVFCYVDDEFGFKNDVYRYIEINEEHFIVRGKKYKINEIKNIKYKLDNFNIKLRDSVYIKIMFEIISDVYKIDSMYIRTDYVISFVLLIDLIKKNNFVINKEQFKELLKIKVDKTIKL